MWLDLWWAGSFDGKLIEMSMFLPKTGLLAGRIGWWISVAGFVVGWII